MRFRLGLSLVVMLAGFALLAVRAWRLQIHADERVTRMEKRQFNSKEVLSPQRGTIFDAKGKALAVNLQVPSLFADPKEIRDPKEFARIVAPILKMSPREILSKIKNRSRQFVWLKRRNDPAIEATIEKLDLQGLHIFHEGMRLYPDRQLAAQVIGFVGVDGTGLEGTERLYDKYLRSRELVVQSQRDRKGRPIFTNDTVVLEPEPGADLHLTIDSVIQHNVETELFQAAVASKSPRAMAIIMDPNDGRVLAMASYPPINPNRLDKASAQSFRNRPVEELFEPGSTFKVMAMAAALEKNAIDPKQAILCRKGSVRLNGKTIHSHVEHAWLTPAEILKYSDNIGTSRIALAVGGESLYATAKNLGFGQDTGIDLPGETAGMFKKPEHWREIDLANISFGQGIGVTAVQMTAALSAVANGGFKVKPYVVSSVSFHDGRELRLESQLPRRRVLSEKTSRTLSNWMEGVTGEDGTAPMAALDGYRTAGKTGTAQKIDGRSGNYSHTKVVSSFMGFAPATRPQLAAIFIFDEPAKADFGGILAAPVFKRVMEMSLEYLGVPHDRALPERVAAKETPKPSKALGAFVAAAEEEGLLPDVRGLTVREVLSKARRLALEVRVVGSGVAVRQTPKPGQPMSGVRRMEVFFESAAERRAQT